MLEICFDLLPLTTTRSINDTSVRPGWQHEDQSTTASRRYGRQRRRSSGITQTSVDKIGVDPEMQGVRRVMGLAEEVAVPLTEKTNAGVRTLRSIDFVGICADIIL